MVKTPKSSNDVMAARMTVGPKKVQMNQSNKSHDLMTQSNMAAPTFSPNQIGQYFDAAYRR